MKPHDPHDPHDPIDVELRRHLSRAPRDADCPADERWLALVAGELDAGGAEALRQHLEGCASCAATAAEARKFRLAIGARSPWSPWSTRSTWSTADTRRRGIRWAVGFAALVALAAAPWLLRFGSPHFEPGAIHELVTALEVSPPPSRDEPGGSDLVFRAGADSAAARAFAAALGSYRDRRWTAACRTLGEHGQRFPEEREARFLAAVACLKAGELDRSEALLAALAAVAGDRRDDARALLDRLRTARQGERR